MTNEDLATAVDFLGIANNARDLRELTERAANLDPREFTPALAELLSDPVRVIDAAAKAVAQAQSDLTKTAEIIVAMRERVARFAPRPA